MHDIHDIINNYNDKILNNNFSNFKELEQSINDDKHFKTFDEDEQFIILEVIKNKFNNKDKNIEKVENKVENIKENTKEKTKEFTMQKSKQVYEFIGKTEKKPYRFNSNYNLLVTNDIAKKIYINPEDISEGALLSSVDKAVFVSEVSEELYQKRKVQFEYVRAIKSPEQRTPPWFAQRNKSITASDCGCVLAENKHEPVYNFIFKKVFGSTFGTNIFCYHGKKFENVVTLMYELINDVIVDEFGLLGHPVYNFLAASPDGICAPYCRDKKTPSPLVGRMIEIKCPFQRKIKYTGEVKGDICPDYYWCQVQLQLECCDLDECDFVQCNIEEYKSRQDFIADTNETSDYKSKKYGIERGVVIELIPTKLAENDYEEKIMKKETSDGVVTNNYHIVKNDAIYDKASFIYQPKLDMTLKELDEWIMQELDKLTNNPGVKLNRIIYWRFIERNTTLIKRDKEWFKNNLVTMRKIWAYVEILRNNNKLAEDWKIFIDSQNKKYNDKIINKVVELIKNEGLFDIVLNAIKEVDPEIKEEINNFVGNPNVLSDSNQIISDEIEQLSGKKFETENENTIIQTENTIIQTEVALQNNTNNKSIITDVDILASDFNEQTNLIDTTTIKKTKSKKETKEKKDKKEDKVKKDRKNKKNVKDDKKEEPINLYINKQETEKVNSKKDSKGKAKIFKSIVIDISDDEE
jgi:putative phage-type endonuclease